MQAAGCSGASGLNCCWDSSLRGFLKCSSLPLRSPHGWELSPPREEFSWGGWLAGLVIPGGPYLLFPIAAKLWNTGAAPGVLIALITAKTLVSPIRLLTYEAPLMGWPLTLARCVPALFVPPIRGILG
jgi:hypothetical protein